MLAVRIVGVDLDAHFDGVQARAGTFWKAKSRDRYKSGRVVWETSVAWARVKARRSQKTTVEPLWAPALASPDIDRSGVRGQLCHGSEPPRQLRHPVYVPAAA